jgi:hypothetical protein
MLKAYLTLLGRSSWSLINSYYAVVEEQSYFPDSVKIYSESKNKTEHITEALKVISKEYSFNPSIEVTLVSEGTFINAGNIIGTDLKTFKEKGYETALDITPGRKPLVAGAILSASKQNADHIYYLMIDSTEDADKPYTLIPRKRQILIDFVEEAKR